VVLVPILRKGAAGVAGRGLASHPGSVAGRPHARVGGERAGAAAWRCVARESVDCVRSV